jgi:hypothetical protein
MRDSFARQLEKSYILNRMQINTTAILELLHKQPDRYIQHDSGNYRMKEPKGSDVIVKEDGREFLVEPTQDQMDDLERQSRLTRDGSRYFAGA